MNKTIKERKPNVRLTFFLAQREGFEPSVLLWEHTRFRVVRVRPLRHLCTTLYNFTILREICQSFGQIFYQECCQNTDNDSRQNTEQAHKRQLDIERLRLHQQYRDACTGNIAQNCPRHANRYKADLRI